MAKKTFSLTLRTKPYLKKYLQTLYGQPLNLTANATLAERPIYFTTNNEFGIVLSAFLFRSKKMQKHLDDHAMQIIHRPTRMHHNKQELRLRADKFDIPLEVLLPTSFLTQRRGGFEILDEHIITVNKFFEKNFESSLGMYVLMQNIAGKETKEALESFCDRFNIIIDEDITFECIKQKEFRYREKLKKYAPQLSAYKAEKKEAIEE